MPRDTVEELDFTSYRVEQPVTDEVLRVLIEAREWLTDPSHWSKGSFFRNANGVSTPADHRNCSSSCAWGALVKAEGGFLFFLSEKALGELQVALGDPSPGAVARFNDDPSTTHADVLALFDRAIARRSEIGA